mmetsp:Transcript_96913/g.263251  ORF Transcript_96913/g.263251 Transcript_96913/m.263251 type:complete len:290 (-) Transcript_96913:286-1155(-)
MADTKENAGEKETHESVDNKTHNKADLIPQGFFQFTLNQIAKLSMERLLSLAESCVNGIRAGTPGLNLIQHTCLLLNRPLLRETGQLFLWKGLHEEQDVVRRIVLPRHSVPHFAHVLQKLVHLVAINDTTRRSKADHLVERLEYFRGGLMHRAEHRATARCKVLQNLHDRPGSIRVEPRKWFVEEYHPRFRDKLYRHGRPLFLAARYALDQGGPNTRVRALVQAKSRQQLPRLLCRLPGVASAAENAGHLQNFAWGAHSWQGVVLHDVGDGRPYIHGVHGGTSHRDIAG